MCTDIAILMNNCIISNLWSTSVFYQPVDVYKVCTVSKHACNLPMVHITVYYFYIPYWFPYTCRNEFVLLESYSWINVDWPIWLQVRHIEGNVANGLRPLQTYCNTSDAEMVAVLRDSGKNSIHSFEDFNQYHYKLYGCELCHRPTIIIT